jgi:hypothetical protein
MINTTAALIDAFGGNSELAQLAGVGRSAVSNWRRFGCIPPRLYLRLAQAGRARGIEIDPGLFRETTSDAFKRCAS